MKKTLFLSFLCVAAMFAGCTSAEDEPQPVSKPEPTEQEEAKDETPSENTIIPVENGVIDMQAVNDFKSGNSAAAFTQVEYHIWDCPENTDGWFEVFDPPHTSLLPRLGIQDGRIWRNFYAGFDDPLALQELYSAWVCYLCETGKEENVFIGTPFGFDEETKILELDGYNFEIVGFDANSFKLGWRNRVNKQKKGWFDSYELYTYTRTEPIDFSSELNTPMNSEKEAAYYMFSKVKAQFGHSINQHDYITGCILDNPIINIAKLKEMLDSYFEQK